MNNYILENIKYSLAKMVENTDDKTILKEIVQIKKQLAHLE